MCGGNEGACRAAVGSACRLAMGVHVGWQWSCMQGGNEGACRVATGVHAGGQWGYLPGGNGDCIWGGTL